MNNNRNNTDTSNTGTHIYSASNVDAQNSNQKLLYDPFNTAEQYELDFHQIGSTMPDYHKTINEVLNRRHQRGLRKEK